MPILSFRSYQELALQCLFMVILNILYIKTVQVTGASVQVASEMLPNSTERAVTISGNSEAVIQCIYHICVIMSEVHFIIQYTKKNSQSVTVCFCLKLSSDIWVESVPMLDVYKYFTFRPKFIWTKFIQHLNTTLYILSYSISIPGKSPLLWNEIH